MLRRNSVYLPIFQYDFAYHHQGMSERGKKTRGKVTRERKRKGEDRNTMKEDPETGWPPALPTVHITIKLCPFGGKQDSTALF